MGQVSLTVLGCASGMPAKERNSSAYLLTTEGGSYLFDAGEGVAQALRKFGKDPLAIRAIFLSHFHPDHCMGLPLLIQMFYLLKRTEPVIIYYPGEGQTGLRSLFELTYLLENRLPFRCDFRVLKGPSVLSENGLEIFICPNTHLRGYEEAIREGEYHNQMQCYSYRINAGGWWVVYSADLGSAFDLARMLEGVDLLITETLHIDFDQLFRMASENKVKRILLTHMSDEQFARGSEFVRQGQKYGIKEVLIASDGLKIDFQPEKGRLGGLTESGFDKV